MNEAHNNIEAGPMTAETIDERATSANVEVSPRIYVASLSDYNDGRLVGSWLEADQEVGELETGIAEMLQKSGTANAEEYAIHDYDGFGGVELGEYESLATVARIARGLKQHGRPFAAWARLAGVQEADADSYRKHYLGSWSSLAEFGEDFSADLGLNRHLVQVPPLLQAYVRIDHEALVQDLLSSGEIATAQDDGQVHVFLAPGTG